MKNIVLTFLALAVTFILVGCSSIPSIQNKPTTISIVTENPDRQFFLEKMAEFNIIQGYKLTDVEFLDLMKQGIELYKFALTNMTLWSAEEQYKFKHELRKTQRAYYDRKGTLALTVLLQDAINAQRAQDKITAYSQALKLLKREQQKDIWTTSEKNGFKKLITQIAQMKSNVEDNYNQLLLAATLLLKYQRIDYVFKHGVYDLSTANRYFNENNNRYFNWWIFRYSRNDMNTIRKAWSLCKRVSENEYTKFVLKCQAKEIEIKLNRITSTAQQETFKNYPVKFYRHDSTYPNWSPKEKAELDFTRSNEKNETLGLENQNLEQRIEKLSLRQTVASL